MDCNKLWIDKIRALTNAKPVSKTFKNYTSTTRQQMENFFLNSLFNVSFDRLTEQDTW